MACLCEGGNEPPGSLKAKKYTGRQIPKEATLRKNYVQHAYEKCLREVKCKLQNEEIWVSVDERMDTVGHHVANVVVVALSAECCCRPYLLMSEGCGLPLNLEPVDMWSFVAGGGAINAQWDLYWSRGSLWDRG
ncbi:hypothetical protein ANN_14487 [Periplaneta americana]|uniref:Uncharacterized protein n=1 Tax=Periplaneta americana TaxID=6978 RepID=A0ABQ8SYK7_PERAM|nr:hypothetical protein ANN_14487 [Periplaneta americana]